VIAGRVGGRHLYVRRFICCTIGTVSLWISASSRNGLRGENYKLRFSVGVQSISH